MVYGDRTASATMRHVTTYVFGHAMDDQLDYFFDIPDPVFIIGGRERVPRRPPSSALCRDGGHRRGNDDHGSDRPS